MTRMKPFSLKRSTRAATALMVAGGALASGAVALSASTANADPTTSAVAQPLAGVGSNTIQDLFDALTGAAPTPLNIDGQTVQYYTPLHDPTTGRQVASFDALDPTTLTEGGTIITKFGGNAFARPNGSGDGLKAMSDAIDGVNWSKTTGGAPSAPVSGQIDFFRSSSAPSGAAGQAITWIDFAHDALTVAALGNSNVTNFASVQQDVTTSELTTAYNTLETSPSVVRVDGDVLLPASLQSGSGTEKTFLTDIGSSATAASTDSPASAQNLEENGANALATAAPGAISTFLTDKGLPASTPVVIVEPFAAGSWIAQANQKALDRSGTARADGADLVNIDGLGGAKAKPYSGSPGSEVPNTAYFESGTYGRDLYVGLPWKAINGKPGQFNQAERNIFGYYGNNAPGSTTALTSTTTNSGQLEGSYVQTTLLSTFGFIAPTINALGAEFNTVTTDGTGS